MERLRPNRSRIADNCQFEGDDRDIPTDLRTEWRYWRECAEENFENLVDASCVNELGEE